MVRLTVRNCLVLVALLYSPLGWCPPPPGIFVPDYQTYDLGEVPVGGVSQVSIALLLNPSFASSGPFVISDNAFFFYSNDEGAFVVTPTLTTCVPGTAVTTTTGCSVTVEFRPTSTGLKNAIWFGVDACAGLSSACPTSRTRGATFSFSGLGIAVPVPIGTRATLVLLAMLLCFLAFLSFHRKGQRP
jgi:hypothetical protein